MLKNHDGGDSSGGYAVFPTEFVLRPPSTAERRDDRVIIRDIGSQQVR